VSRASVYKGLKNALKVRGLPFHHFEDENFSITFCSWDDYAPFDAFLDSLPIPNDLKLNIYAERVGDRSDGVAVTVSDEVQRLGYMTSRLDMPAKLAAFEGLLSSLLRSGVELLDYDYETFTVDLRPEVKSDISLPHYISHWEYPSGQAVQTIHLEFAT
jgi:hypothetical protein